MTHVSLEAVLRDLMSDAERAADVIQALTRVGVLTYDGANHYPYGYYASEQRRGRWVREFRGVAEIDYARGHDTGAKWAVAAVRFAPPIHAPAALLARLIEVHRERLQRVAALQPEVDELAKAQRGVVR